MAIQQTMHNLEQGDVNLPESGRPVIRSNEGVISSGHYLTSMAGMRILLAGGNAFDAMVASSLAAAVVEPIASYSLAAEGVFMLYDSDSGDLLSLSGQGGAPGAATAEFYRSRGHERIPTGPGKDAPLSFTQPGIVDAFINMLERYGTMSFEQVAAPAISYAEDGIPHYEYMLERLRSRSGQEQFDNFPPGGWEVFYEDREVPAPGAMMRQPGLANTLKAMRDASQAASGSRSDSLKAARNAFYEGPIAELIVEETRKVGGILTLDDLSGYHAQFCDPVSTTFHGCEVWGQDSWTQGPMLMQALNILENFDLRAMGHNSPAYIHTVAEALKLCFGDREAFYGDPDFATVPIDGLLSKEYAAVRAEEIDPEGAYPEQRPAGDPWRFSKKTGRTAPQVMAAAIGPDTSADDGTTHVSVLDKRGNLVCGTISGGSFSKSVFFPELGACLSTRIEMFNCEPGHPNVVEPGKRPRTTLVNYIVAKDGKPVMTVGCPGGDNQVQGNLQLILNSLVFGMDPQQAVEAPRFATSSNVNSFYPHVYYPGQLDLEDGFPESTEGALKALGHQIHHTANCGLGATVSVRDPETGSLSTGADPRRACYALAL
ncbi:MAG: gamma-glutamyltransferase family protein [Chloroflexi bacterium]|nr:gamma-glutamyltransferase family protein [Chloroflexota bacterium]